MIGNAMDFDENQKKLLAYQKEFARYNRRRRRLFRAYFKYWHRFEVVGLDRLPQGPGLVALNHGGAFDLDIVAMSDCCHPTRPIHSLIDSNWHYLNHWWGRYWVGSGIPLWTRGGTRWEYLDPYLDAGGAHFPGLVAIYPEGHSGTFAERKVLHRFFPGVVRIALRYRVPIIPAAMVGFHYVSPILFDLKRDHGPNDPVFLPLSLPVKLKTEFGEPFELSDYYGRELSREEEWHVANQVVRPRVAALLAKHVEVTLEPAE